MDLKTELEIEVYCSNCKKQLDVKLVSRGNPYTVLINECKYCKDNKEKNINLLFHEIDKLKNTIKEMKNSSEKALSEDKILEPKLDKSTANYLDDVFAQLFDGIFSVK